MENRLHLKINLTMKNILLTINLILFFFLANGQNPEKEDSLFEAVRHSQLYIAQQIIESGVPANILNKNGETLLYVATEHARNTDIIKLLINNKANPNKKSGNGKVALHRVIEDPYYHYSKEFIADYLISAGTDINLADNNGNTAAHLLNGRYAGKLAMLLAYRNADFKIKNNKGQTPYEKQIADGNKAIASIFKDKVYTPQFLAEFGNFEDFKKAVKNNLKDINKPDKQGFTLIYYTSSRHKGAYKFTEFLLNSGADINTSYLRALDVSLENNNPRLAKLLRKRSKDTGIDLSRPLNVAIESGKLELVKLMVESGAKVNATNPYGIYPIHSACGWNYYNIKKKLNPKIINYLIEKGADINQFSSDKVTPMMYAIENNSPAEIITFLASKGAVLNKGLGKNSCLHYAISYKSDKSLAALLSLVKNKNAKNKLGETALFYAISRYSANTNNVKLILQAGVSVTEANNKGETPLYKAIKTQAFDIAKLLMEYPQNYKVETKKDKKSLLHASASVSGGNAILEQLIANGADLHSKDSNGETPLLYALHKPISAERCELLLSPQTVNIKNNNNYTPIAIATITKQKIKILEILLSAGADINYTNEDNKNLADMALANNNFKALDFYLKKGLQLSPIGNEKKDGEMLIAIAKQKSSYTMLNNILVNTTDISNVSYEDKTPLHIVAENPKAFDAVKLLIEKKADLFAEDENGENPLHSAVIGGNTEIINYISKLQEKKIKKHAKQTAKLNTEIIINDFIWNSKFSKEDYYSYTPTAGKAKYYSSQSLNDIDIQKLIVKKMNSKKGGLLYSPNYKPYLPKHRKQKKITFKTAEHNLGGDLHKTTLYDPDTFEELVQIENFSVDKNEIQAIKFWEKWNFDEYKFTMQKTVKAYSPVRIEDMFDEATHFITPAFTIVSDDYKNKRAKKKALKKMQLFKKIKYEFQLNNEKATLSGEQRNAPLWTDQTQKRFKKMIVDAVLTGKKKAYDFTTGQAISTKEARKRLGESAEIIGYYDDEFEFDDQGNIIEHTALNPYNIAEIQAVIFHENWYIDKNTMRIHKEVVALSPVRYYVEPYSDESIKKKILFTVFLNKKDEKSYAQTEIITPFNTTLQKTKNSPSYFPEFEFKVEGESNISFENLYNNAHNTSNLPLFQMDDFESHSAFSPLNYSALPSQERKMNYSHPKIEGVKCYENWAFDENKFSLQKDVFAYSPFISYDNEDDLQSRKYKLVGYIIQPKKQDKSKMKYLKTISYEIGYTTYDEDRNMNTPHIEDFDPLFWNEAHTKKFSEQLFTRAFSGKAKCYDYSTGNPIDTVQIKKNCITRTYIADEFSGYPQGSEQHDYLIPQEVKSLIFTEKWYINTKTLAIKKEVISVSPVGYYTPEGGTAEKRKIPFTLKFNAQK